MSVNTSGTPSPDGTIAAFLHALPPERRAELKAIVQRSRERQADHGAWLAGHDGRDPWDAEERAGVASPSAARAPAMSVDAARLAADALVSQIFHKAGADVLARTPPADGQVIPLSEVTPVAVRWLSPGRLAAGKITILDGDPGLGKSTLLCELAARITRGEALPGGAPAEPRGVLLLSAEDDLHDTIRPRLDAAGGDPRRVFSLLSVPDGTPEGRPFAIPDDAPRLADLVTRHDAALVIIDPLVAYLQPGLNANSDQDVRRALAALKRVGEETGAAIVAVRHLNKSTGANPLYRGGGSIGIIGAARCGLLLARDPHDPNCRILAATKGNLGRPPASLAFYLDEDSATGVARVAWDGESHWTAAQLLRVTEDDQDDGESMSSRLEVAQAWLREALANGPRPVKEVQQEAEAAGYSGTTLKRARRAEGVVARKDRSAHNGGWILALPGDQGAAVQLPDRDPRDPRDALPPAAHQTAIADEDRLPGNSRPAHRLCVDCGTPLDDERTSNRCASCLADALTT